MPKREAKPIKRRRRSKALTAEDRENECISLAYDLVEQRLRDGTATAAETVHFLKLGSSREKIERKHIQTKIDYEEVKADSIASQRTSEETYLNAIKAFRRYSGAGDEDEEDYYD